MPTITAKYSGPYKVVPVEGKATAFHPGAILELPDCPYIQHLITAKRLTVIPVPVPEAASKKPKAAPATPSLPPMEVSQ